MTRDRNGLIVFAALMLAGCLVLLLVANARSTTGSAALVYQFVPLSPSVGAEQPRWTPGSVPTAHSSAPSQAPTEPRSAPPTPKPTQRPTGRIVAPSVAFRGIATWQPLAGYFASAGPKLRAAGVKVGQTVRVCAGRCVNVVIWPGGCWCPDRKGVPVLLDLSVAAFGRLADPSLGVLEVTVSW